MKAENKFTEAALAYSKGTLKFKHFFKLTRSLVFGMILDRFGYVRDIEDINQEIMLKVYKKFDTLKETSKFVPWLKTLVVNHMTDVFRSRAREGYTIKQNSLMEDGERVFTEDIFEEIPHPSGSAEDAYGRKEFQCQIAKAMNQVEDCFREVFVLIDIYGFDYMTASKVLDIPMGTLKSRTNRARKYMKERMVGLMA